MKKIPPVGIFESMKKIPPVGIPGIAEFKKKHIDSLGVISHQDHPLVAIVYTVGVMCDKLEAAFPGLHPVSITRFPLSRFSPGAGLLRNPLFILSTLRFSRGWVRKDGNLVMETGCNQ